MRCRSFSVCHQCKVSLLPPHSEKVGESSGDETPGERVWTSDCVPEALASETCFWHENDQSAFLAARKANQERAMCEC